MRNVDVVFVRSTSPVLALMLTLWFAETVSAVQGGVTLFTEDEARELRIEENAWDPVPKARSASLGPAIVMHLPEITRVDGNETIETTSPTHVLIEFQQNQAPVDMGSLEVTAKKGPFKKSLTNTLAPYVEGTRLAVERIEVPAGKFQIQILVKDLEGHETIRTFRLIVDD